MPQAIEVVGQAEQQRLADLHGQAAPRSARGKFALATEMIVSTRARWRYGFSGKARYI